MICQLRKGLFNDPHKYLLSVFLVFLDKLCTNYQFSAEILQRESAKSMVECLLKLFA